TLVAQRVVEAEEKLERALGHFEKIDGNLQAANEAFDDLNANRATLKAELDTLEETVTKTENRSLYRVLNSPLLPAAVMLMELHNVTEVTAALEQNVRTIGSRNASVRLLSARYDIAYYTIMMTERIMLKDAIVDL